MHQNIIEYSDRQYSMRVFLYSLLVHASLPLILLFSRKLQWKSIQGGEFGTYNKLRHDECCRWRYWFCDGFNGKKMLRALGRDRQFLVLKISERKRAEILGT